jgi:predicted phosphodiesterase
MRVAVLSDIHSNLVALDGILARLGSVDAVWHLGDVVGYGPEPDRVVERLDAIGAVGVRGNHDAAAVGGPEIEWFNPEARTAIEWTRDRIDATTAAWLTALPEVLVIGDYTLVHGSPREPLREYVTSIGAARAALDGIETRHGLHGHTHVPVAFVEREAHVGAMLPEDGTVLDVNDDRLFLNPGSVGQPRDGDPASSCLVLDTEAATVTWIRSSYDIAAVQASMRAARLPARLAERLDHGL